MTAAALPSHSRRSFAFFGLASSTGIAILFGAALYGLSVQQERAQQWIIHTHEVLNGIETTRGDVLDLQSALRGFVITGLEQDLHPIAAARQALTADAQRLWRLTGDSPTQRRSAAELDTLLQKRLETVEAIVAARRDGPEAALAIGRSLGAGQQTGQLRDLLQRMSVEETKLLAGRLDDDQRLLGFARVAVALMVGAFIATLIFLHRQ